jgi:hypothetical protein
MNPNTFSRDTAIRRGLIHGGMIIDIFGLIFIRHPHDALASDMEG